MRAFPTQITFAKLPILIMTMRNTPLGFLLKQIAFIYIFVFNSAKKEQ